MSSPYIYQRLIDSGSMSGSTEQGVRLSAGNFARQFGTSDWTRIRVGMRYRLYNSSSITTLTGKPRFMFGFCNGTTNIPGSATIDQFLGVIWNDTSPNTIGDGNWWIWNETSNRTLNFCSYSLSPTPTTGNTNISYTTYISTNYQITADTCSCDALFVDIIKVSTYGYQGYVFARQNRPTSNAHEYYPYENFISDLQSTTPSRTNYSSDLETGVFAMSQSVNYPFNSVCVYLERSYPMMEIIDLYISRLA